MFDFRSILTAFCIGVLAGQAQAKTLDEGTLKALMNEANRVTQAIQKGDHEVIVEALPPQLVERGGGASKIQALLKKVDAGMKRAGYRYSDIVLQAPESLIDAEQVEIALLPSLMSLKGPEGIVVSQGYMIASRPLGGETWNFMDASGVKDRNAMLDIFPGYPADQPIPVTREPKSKAK